MRRISGVQSEGMNTEFLDHLAEQLRVARAHPTIVTEFK